MAVLFTEHSMDVVFAYADRMIVLARGRLIAEGKPLEHSRPPQGAGGVLRHRQDLREERGGAGMSLGNHPAPTLLQARGLAPGMARRKSCSTRPGGAPRRGGGA
jgi:energy-coupling factor transporter ATP-binding protein EcfA2